MWVGDITWAKGWTIKFPREGFQNCIICGGQLMSEATSSVKMAVPSWHGWPLSLLSQTIYPPCLTHAHSHPQRSVPSPLNLSVLLSLGQRSWLFSVEPCVCEEVVWSPHVHICAFLTALDCIHSRVKFASGSFFVLGWTTFYLRVLQGLKWTEMLFLDISST